MPTFMVDETSHFTRLPGGTRFYLAHQSCFQRLLLGAFVVAAELDIESHHGA